MPSLARPRTRAGRVARAALVSLLLLLGLLWLADRELTLALNTGRNPEHVEKLRGDVKRWTDALDTVSLPGLYDDI